MKARKFFRTYYLAVVAGLFLLILTFFLFLDTYQRVEDRNEILFAFRAENALSSIEKRMQDYIQILRGAQGLFAVSDTLTLEEWKEYIDVQKVDKNYPGILGLGYTHKLAPQEVVFFEEQVRSSGFPSFRIWPDTAAEVRTSILYLEPFTPRNQRAFGFDMFTEPTRRKAMKRARDTGKPALTSIVRLVQETNIGVQNGFLLYLPIYRRGSSLTNILERKAALTGWVYSAFRVNDLMKGILQNRFNDLHITIYDGPYIQEESLLYQTGTSTLRATEQQEGLFLIKPLMIAGHSWQLFISAKPEFGYEKQFPWFILFIGTLISSLIFLILYYLISIRRSNYLRALITDHATAALVILDKHDYATFANPAAESMLGFSQDEFRQQTFHKLTHQHPNGIPHPEADCPLIKSLKSSGTLFNLETVLYNKSGSPVSAVINAQPVYERGRIISHLLEIRDIGPEKLVEKALLKKNKNLQTLNNIGKNLSAELELNKLLQLITDSCTELTSAEFGAFFYNQVKESGEKLMLYTLSGASMEAFKDYPMPRATDVFAPTFHGEQVVRSDDITLDERFGKNKPYYGMPKGHLPVRSYMAVPVISRGGEVLGGLFFGHSKTAVFNENAEDIVKGIAAQAAIAIDNSKLFETLSLRNSELLKINNDLDNFVYTASHDLKAPVLNIEGLILALNAALMRDKPERTEQILDKIKLSIEKFKETIQALTQVAKTNKNLEQEVETFDLKSLIIDTLFSIDDTVKQANARVELAVDCHDFSFSKANMRSILHNLLTNALKYRDPKRTPLIRISCQKTNNGIELSISDNGLGINKAYLPKIFTMFSRYHTHVEGTGIGLYLVNRIVENNGGSIKVESEAGEGTTFILQLPQLKRS